MFRKNLVVIGGGAAGYFCAVNAARMNPNLDVTQLEKTNRCLRKVQISGGGRCNLTHASSNIVEMCAQYPRGSHFLKKAFHHFFTSDSMRWFEERGVALKTESDGRVFPVSDSSLSIVDCLIREAAQYSVRVIINCEVSAIQPKQEKIQITTSRSEIWLADYICIACGGYSKTQMFDWIMSMDHSIETPLPSLFTFNMPGHSISSLMGITVKEVEASVQGTGLKEKGSLLITHWGMSGPVILRLSAWGARELAGQEDGRPYQFILRINWLPEIREESLREMLISFRGDKGASKISDRCPFGLPLRLWKWILQQSGIVEEWRWAELTASARRILARNLSGQHFEVKGKTIFKEEFVTAGGIRLSEIDPHTMQSRIRPNLFFAGEVMDVDGITGGYNFQHAWTSGFLAAESIVKMAVDENE